MPWSFPEAARLRRLAWLRRLWTADTLLLDAGAKGELIVARIRVLLTGLLLVIPLQNYLGGNDPRESYIGLAIAGVSFAVALLVYLAVRRDTRRRWIGVVTTVFDVTWVSAGLTTFLLVDQPHTAVNSKVLYEVYFLAIAATCIRYDVRLCILAGALAVAEYGAIVWYASTHWDLNGPAFAPYVYGMFSVSAQVSRLVLLAVAALLSGMIVARASELRRLSALDRLTGIFNRGYLDERLPAELSRARRSGHPLSVVMLDADHFKRFNDRHGHAAGDAGLKAIATLMRQMLRRSDTVARYGGEEFVVVMPDTSAEMAVEKMEAIRVALEQTAIRLPRETEPGRLTVSAGIATFPADGMSADQLLDEADARLFQAKESGRNRVVGRASSASHEAGGPLRLASS